MYCCDALADAADRGALYIGAKNRIDDGRIVNEQVNIFIFVHGGHHGPHPLAQDTEIALLIAAGSKECDFVR